MWSLYFVLLEFLNEPLPWRICKDNKADDVRDIKGKCLSDPEKHLWNTTTKTIPEVRAIFYSLERLNYSDKPDYNFFRQQLIQMLSKEEAKRAATPSGDTKTGSSV